MDKRIFRTGIGIIALMLLSPVLLLAGEQRAAQETGPSTAEVLHEHQLELPELSGEITAYGLLAAESEHLKLYVHPETAEVAVLEKTNGYVWYSNPPQHELDPVATTVNKAKLASQLVISYFNEKGHESFANSFEESVLRQQFDIRKTSNGVKVIYQIGDNDKGLEAIPEVISKERFETIVLAKIKDEKTRFEVSKRYFYNEGKQVYERKPMPDYVVKDIVALFDSVGYRMEDAVFDNTQNGVSATAQPRPPVFTIPVQYSLEQHNLVVSIAMNEVIEPKQFPLHTVQLLGFMGAAGTDQSGYILVPDGAGALIYLNNGRKSAEPYNVPLYGEDEMLQSPSINRNGEVSRLPVFGIKQGSHGLFGIIEQGDALASITADISGRLNSYNTVSPLFRVRSTMPYQYRAGKVSKEVPLFQSLYDGELTIRYSFLAGDEAASYAGMAAYYREYLADKHGLQRMKQAAHIPFFLDMIGAVNTRRTFLGIPYQAEVALTTYKQAEQVLQRLKEEGVNQLSFIYSGWFNQGLDHSSATSIRLPGGLGGESGFRKLVQFAGEHDIAFYPDTALLRVYRTGKGFSPSSAGSKTLSGEPMFIAPTNPVLGIGQDDERERGYYLLSPARLPAVSAMVSARYMDLGLTGIALRDLAESPSSDMNKRQPVSRQHAVGIVTDSMRSMAGQLDRQLVSGGNAYALPFADAVINAPLSSSTYSIADEEIPFYAMVLGGYKPLAGAPINLGREQDTRHAMLKLLESGAGVHYRWYYAQPDAIKDTKYNDLFASSYADWLDEALQMYREVDEVLRHVQGQLIVGHAKLGQGVYRTTFENGRSITVNYNKFAVDVEGERLEGQNYRVGGG